MEKDVTNVVEGVAAGKVVQAIMRKYIDPWLAPSMLYSATKYWTDLKALGYIAASGDSALSDEQIGAKILLEGGYTFSGYKTAGAPGNLLGSNRLMANKYTYMSAVGQKVPAYQMPSCWGSLLIGGVAVADTFYDFLGLSEYKLAEMSLGTSLVGDAAVRALGADGVTAAPSGFDISATAPPMQYLDNSTTLDNLRKLAAENQRLSQEISSMRSARAMPSPVYNASTVRASPGVQAYQPAYPEVRVSDNILPSKGASVIKERVNMIGGNIQKATPERVKASTGLVTLTGGR